MTVSRPVLNLLFFLACPLCCAQTAAVSKQGQELRHDGRPITALTFSGNGHLLAVGRLRSVTLCDVGTGRALVTLKGIEGTVSSAAFAQDGNLLAVGTGTPGRDGTVELWDWKTERKIRAFKGHTDLVYGIAFRPDGRQLAAVSYDHLVSLWNLDAPVNIASKAEAAHYLRDHTDSVYGAAYSPNGRTLATAAADRTVKVWDTVSGKRLFTLSESTGELYSVAFRPDGRQIAAGGVDKTLRVWSVDTGGGTLVHSAFAHEGAILKVVYSHDGKQIFTSGEDNTVKQWDAETLEERAVYANQSDWPDAIAVSPIDKLLAVGRHDGSLTVYDTLSHKPVSHGILAGEGENRRRGEKETEGIGRSSRLSFALCAEMGIGDAEVLTQGGNVDPMQAMAVPVPCVISGTLWNAKIGSSAPVHYFRFAAKRGEMLVLDVMARRAGSLLDSEIEVLDAQGRPVERAVLRAVGQTEITLSDRDSASPGIRLLLRPEFRISDYVLAGRELMQIYALPKGPDDDYLFRNNRGQRSGFLGTTPEFHTVGWQVYKVEIHPPGSAFSPNGMPLTHLFYKNDDGGAQYGRDSYLEFTPPADGDYFVRLRDVRGQQGEKFTYRLRIHPPRPDFKISLSPASIVVPKSGAVPVTVECERYDGFEGEIAVRLEGLPPGFTATEGTIEAGESSALLLVTAALNAETPKPEMEASYHVIAAATIGGKEVSHAIDPDNKNRRLSVGAASNVQVVTDINGVTLRPGEDTVVEARITRLNGINNRIPLDIRNLPFGVRVVNIGLNGVLINEQETTRKFTLHCDPWVKPQTRTFYVTANVEGGIANTAPPLLLRITDMHVSKR